MSASLNPLPSLIRASAQDAANMAMRKAGRKAWSDDDYNIACETQERLIRSLYGRPGDHNNPNIVYIRFQIAEQMERKGLYHLRSNTAEIHDEIEAIMSGVSA